MSRSILSLGICQTRQSYDVGDNIRRALEMAFSVASSGADIVILPEMFLCPYEPQAISGACSMSEEALDALAGVAEERSVYIVAGSVPYREKNGMIFNRSVVIGPDGIPVLYHDKIHLFDCSPPGGPQVRESATVSPGGGLSFFDTPWARASVLICYDLRFSPLVQLLADRGVGLLFVPAAFSFSTGSAHWEMLVRMRALELQGFVVGVQPAVNTELSYVPWGHSMVASPWGEVLFDAGSEEVAGVVEIDLSEISKIRSRFPLLDHRRDDLYSTCWRGDK